MARPSLFLFMGGSLSVEEKQLVKQMKIQLNAMGIPREQWAVMVQEQITEHRHMKKQQAKMQPSKPPGRIGRAFGQIKKKIQKLIMKIMAKRSGQDMNDAQLDAMMQMMEDPNMMGGMGGSGMDPMGGMGMGGPEIFPPMESLGQHGTFLTNSSPKKRIEVDMGFDDDDDDDD